MISRSLPRPLLRVLPHPVLSVLLLLVWLLLVDSFAIGHWLLGAFLGVCIPLLTNRLLVGRSQEWHPLLLLKLLVLVMWDILVANIQVARLTLGPIERLRPAFVEVPIELENDLAISVLVSIVSLTPGSVSSDLSDDRKTLLVHGLDVPDKAALIAEIKQLALQAFADLSRGLLVAAGQQHGELLAADPPEQVATAQRGTAALGDTLEDLVADLVADRKSVV